MRRALKWWVAVVVLAAAAFAQASVSMLACHMERGAMSSHAVQSQGGVPCACDDGEGDCADHELSNLCVAHCTSDLQLAGEAVALLSAPGDAPALLPPRRDAGIYGRETLEAAPPASVPIRILIHSFLI